ncbi:alpha-mannosidase/octanoyl-[GcvH]:protein N-octanoyltransferase [Pullulanibacillus pueri]|uniref:Glycosyl hydrolase n=1 Tax=Pullulanibacillus pueri TaxID=1437324 RepID=A0A8J2ZVX2_9BACL|nr:alpha-mannosidase [Pullulanibacillus pueri]MBM7682079.1 alpha-mannosidase/octanoyl-[GcvH]:protein N-octanoyltransferase [Pullulanibacillus pueri]GGH80065.1 glycosyl hydrolase [Pullulanibacillus pueri]
MKKVYIISHSHWDREWYLPYEQHHMRLVQLMDDLLELFEKDPEFNSFHLDGQTIILDDYLQVRPEKREAVQKYIHEGKLKIGPFYILQDDFLISSESNVRNMLIGHKESLKWGSPVKIGYFPDTFGNMGQAPQLMQQAGIEAATFGRGVKPTGFNNVVINDEKYTSQFSEMWWEGADHSKILGILFANWYSNGNEIPVEKEAAKRFWDQKLKDATQFASTDHLLMMNGCDHQPVQKDVTQAIRVANELYPDIEFIHSNFEDYLEAVKQDLPEELSTVEGELTSQETDGWYTLANTASSRIYLKQENTEVSRLLENITEPLATMAYSKNGDYPHDTLDYAWKLLLQNHPHDSICGCSIDAVHREMMTRFEKAKEVGKFIKDEAAEALAQHIDTSAFPEQSRPFIVFNTSGSPKTGIVEVEIEWKRLAFSSGRPDQLYKALKEEPLPALKVINAQGQEIPAHISDKDVRFHYDLPKDRFRQPFMAMYVTVQLHMQDMLPLSWHSFALVEGRTQLAKSSPIVQAGGRTLENDQLKVQIEDTGTLTVTHKATQETYSNLLVFEDVGDIGNEYIFKQPNGDEAILSTDGKTEVTVVENHELYGEVLLTQQLQIPVSADETLEEEQKAVIEFRQRQAGRAKQMKTLELKTAIKLDRYGQQLQFETSFDNQMKDHRLRVLFQTGIQADEHEADSIYEVVKRPNQVNETWQNPTNPQHQHAFVNLNDGRHGVTVANYGLNEYEVIGDTIALTLLRAVGELGDWGYFPTPEAQCQGEHKVQYAIGFHGETDKLASYHEAINFQIPFTSQPTDRHAGEYEADHQFVELEGEAFRLTAFKRKEKGNHTILRGYNLTTERRPVSVRLKGNQPKRCNLLEEVQTESLEPELRPAEIVTYIWED